MKTTYKDLLRSFPTYIIHKWRWLGLPHPTPLQLEIAQFLQESQGAWALIKGFRGIAKSWITASYAEWCWLRDRDYRVMIVSGNQNKADEISLFIRQCIDTWSVLEPLRWADYEKLHARWGIKQFNVKGSPVDIAPSCKAVGIGGMLVGSRAHLIIGDDVEIPANSDTVEARAKLLAAIGEFSNILLPGGQVKLLGTPQSEESVYNTLEERGVETRVWPARVPTEEEYKTYHGTLSPKIQEMYDLGLHGQPTEPDRFPEEVLEEKAAVLTRSAWRLQFMLDTSLADALKYPLKLNDLLVTSLDKSTAPLTIVWNGGSKNRVPGVPQVGFTGDYLVEPMFIGDEWKPYERKILVVDPSGRGDNETAWAVIGTLAGRFYLLDWGGYLDGFDQKTLQGLTGVAMSYQVNELVYESNFGDGAFGPLIAQTMRGIYECAITEVRAKGQKEARILEILEPTTRSHRLVMDLGALKRDLEQDQAYSLCYQMTRLTRERGCLRYDDRVDVVAMGIQHLQLTLGVNIEQATAEIKTKQKLEEIRNILEEHQWFGQRRPPVKPKRSWGVI